MPAQIDKKALINFIDQAIHLAANMVNMYEWAGNSQEAVTVYQTELASATYLKNKIEQGDFDAKAVE